MNDASERPEAAGPEPSDDALMARVTHGDRLAFAALVERHENAIIGYLARLSGSRDRAEDLGQEAFLRLFRSAARYRGEGNLLAYLFRIATNLLRSEERRERRRRLIAPLLALVEPEPPTAPGSLLRDELQAQVAAAVASLPLRWRVPLVLHEIEGWPYAAIASQLALNEGTVKSRIHRGRRALRDRLEPYWNGGAPWPTPTRPSTTLATGD